MQQILDAKGTLIEDSNNSSRRFSHKIKHNKKRGGKQTKIIRTKEIVENDKSLVLHAHAMQHKAQQLIKKLLLKGPNACADASADASADTHTTGTNIPVEEILCNTIPMQTVNFVENMEEPWSDNERKEEL